MKGRVVFDLNVLALDDRLWLDIDRRQVEMARKHLDRYIITEDVRLAEPAPRLERHAILGPRAAEAAAQMGLGNLAAMSQLQHVAGQIESSPTRFIRNDFAGLMAVELVVVEGDGRKGQTVIESLAGKYQWTQLSPPTIDVLRIEAGIPASVDDIDEEVVPPETGQIERGISYHKGCYLGQEVIERMRSHGILARRLVGLRIGGEGPVAHNTEVTSESAVVGRVTSCFSDARRRARARIRENQSCENWNALEDFDPRDRSTCRGSRTARPPVSWNIVTWSPSS